MDPWYKVVTPRKEVREGRSFNPDEFAIALEQVVAGTAPEDYRDPQQFFARTCFTRALREHVGMILRRLSGKTENTAPVVTLITQFGGGKTHTLTTLYHLAKNGEQAAGFTGVAALLKDAGLSAVHGSVGAGYLDRNWPPALKQTGAWPLASLRQSFLNGSLTRFIDPDTILRNKIVEFVVTGDFGLASGQKLDGTYERVWFLDPIAPDEVTFEAGVYLLTKTRAAALKAGAPAMPVPGSDPVPRSEPGLPPEPSTEPGPEPGPPGVQTKTIRLVGFVPPEVWNRLGTKVLPKLRAGSDLKVGVDFSVTVGADTVGSLTSDLRQALEDLGLTDKVRIE